MERYVSVALSVGSPLLGVTQHLARWSSDFPPYAQNIERSPGLLTTNINLHLIAVQVKLSIFPGKMYDNNLNILKGYRGLYEGKN